MPERLLLQPNIDKCGYNGTNYAAIEIQAGDAELSSRTEGVDCRPRIRRVLREMDQDKEEARAKEAREDFDEGEIDSEILIDPFLARSFDDVVEADEEGYRQG